MLYKSTNLIVNNKKEEHNEKDEQLHNDTMCRDSMCTVKCRFPLKICR